MTSVTSVVSFCEQGGEILAFALCVFVIESPWGAERLRNHGVMPAYEFRRGFCTLVLSCFQFSDACVAFQWCFYVCFGQEFHVSVEI